MYITFSLKGLITADRYFLSLSSRIGSLYGRDIHSKIFMPKARKKKSSTFESSPVKSVFLFGNPNKGKLDVLWQMVQNLK